MKFLKLQILSFLLVLSTSLYARYDWQQVDPNFARAYETAEQTLQQAIQRARDEGRTLRTGELRARQHQDKWQEVSFSRKLHIYYGNDELDYKPQRRGKVYVEVENMQPGEEYLRVVFDVSGDYYRVERGTFNGRYLDVPDSDFQRYVGVYGEDIDKPDNLNFYQWRNFFREETHFKAKP